jgi:mannitol/fructose-specific phosphotransferase system IIA component (Ntr-type)
VDVINLEVNLPNLTVISKDEAIGAMVEHLGATGHIRAENLGEIIAAVLHHEATAPTGLGRGIAMPNARVAAVNRIVGAVGRSKGGVQFDSPDGEPVHTIFLILAPAEQLDDLRRALELVMRRGTPQRPPPSWN